MRFYNREQELGILRQAVAQPTSAMVVVSGRRRVGKSRLVDEFLGRHGGLKAIIVPKEERQVAADLAEIFGDGFRPKFDSVKEALEYFFTKCDERILFIDEFPNLLEVNPAIPHELQRLWELHARRTAKVLILSGSYAGMVDRIFTRQKAPLFNRASFKIILQPLGPDIVWAMQEDIGIRDPVQKIANYCIFGGIPYYYEILERHRKPPVERLFFDAGHLAEEGQDILRQEFGGAYRKYFSILEAIGYGFVAGGEIAGRMGIRQTTLSKYIMSLQNDFRLIERAVPFGQNPARSKKGAYAIADNLLAFWFTMVYGKARPPTAEELNGFLGKRFERLCASFLWGWLAGRGERPLRAGKWWGSVKTADGTFEQREIDVIVETEKRLYIGECKWTDGNVGEGELRRLQESAGALRGGKPVTWVMFTKRRCKLGEGKDVLLFDAERMTKALPPARALRPDK